FGSPLEGAFFVSVLAATLALADGALRGGTGSSTCGSSALGAVESGAAAGFGSVVTCEASDGASIATGVGRFDCFAIHAAPPTPKASSATAQPARPPRVCAGVVLGRRSETTGAFVAVGGRGGIIESRRGSGGGSLRADEARFPGSSAMSLVWVDRAENGSLSD